MVISIPWLLIQKYLLILIFLIVIEGILPELQLIVYDSYIRALICILCEISMIRQAINALIGIAAHIPKSEHKKAFINNYADISDRCAKFYCLWKRHMRLHEFEINKLLTIKIFEIEVSSIKHQRFLEVNSSITSCNLQKVEFSVL